MEREKQQSPLEKCFGSWRSEDGYVPTVGRWGNEWVSEGRHLPEPSWGQARAPITFPTVEAYEELAAKIELVDQQILQQHNYNSVGNFVSVYSAFKKSGQHDFSQFLKIYQPPVTPEHHTCVGLALTLLEKLAVLDPRLESSAYVVSCDELVDDIEDTISEDPVSRTVQKEHVMVACKLEIAGRLGVFILDPGYHVARVVTVMADQLYPHTGCFTQSDESSNRKDYEYTLSSDCNYVIWRVKECRGDAPETITNSAVFVSRPFLNPVAVTERRNLVYNFRSLLSRDTKGQLISGIYFPVKPVGQAPASFTIFHQSQDKKIRQKINFSHFQGSLETLEEKELSAVEQANQMLNFKPGKLTEMLQTLATITSDREFVDQMLQINEDINSLADSDGEEDEEYMQKTEVKREKESLEEEKKEDVPSQQEEKSQQIDVIGKKQVLIYDSLHFKDILQALMKKLKQIEYSDHLELFSSWAKQLAVS